MADKAPAKKPKMSKTETIRRLRERLAKAENWNGKRYTNTTKRVCRSCEWWMGETSADATERAECRRYPPANNEIIVTDALYGCGEHKRGVWGFAGDLNE